MKRAHLASAALAAGALASIATSQATWQLTDTHDLDLILGDQVSLVTRQVRVTLSGDEPHPFGSLQVGLEATAARDGAGAATVRVRISDDADPARSDQVIVDVRPGAPAVPIVVDADPFVDCAPAPCDVVFTLEVERTADPGGPSVTVEGAIDVLVTGSELDAPAGTELRLEIFELEP